MADYIKREDAVKQIENAQIISDGENCGYCCDDISISSIPAANVRENVRGEWKYLHTREFELSYGTTVYEPVYMCSACGRKTESYIGFDEPSMPEYADFPNFCPWCGAEMRGETKDD